MIKPDTVKLGDETFAVKRPKLGELRGIIDALEQMTGKSGGGLIDGAVAVVVAGLRPAHPDITADALLDIEATTDELNEAVGVVLRAAGLRQTDNAEGEAAPQLAAA